MTKKYKQISLPKTILINLLFLGWPLLAGIYLFLCFGALDTIEFHEPILKFPFIVLIAYSALKAFTSTEIKGYYVLKGGGLKRFDSEEMQDKLDKDRKVAR